jgi:hypothetical protein
MGCLQATQQKTIKPTKPKLTIIKREDGGMCLNKEDTSKLGTYIIELESR